MKKRRQKKEQWKNWVIGILVIIIILLLLQACEKIPQIVGGGGGQSVVSGGGGCPACPVCPSCDTPRCPPGTFYDTGYNECRNSTTPTRTACQDIVMPKNQYDCNAGYCPSGSCLYYPPTGTITVLDYGRCGC